MNKVLRQIGIVDDSFELVKVSDLVRRKVIAPPMDGNHGEIHPKGDDFVDVGVPFIMASDINCGRVDYKGCKFISVKQADSLRKGFAKNGDVLVTHKATIGRTAIVDFDGHPYVMLTPQVTYYRVIEKGNLDYRYLMHYFDSSLFQQTLKMWAGSGSTRAYLGITAQHNLPVILPPIAKQQKIAAILSAYDDLIENNKRRIALLEKMAEEIYREWFVRFRFPGYQTAEFEKGIPKSFDLIKFSSICRFEKGKNPEQVREICADEDLPYVNVDTLNGNSNSFAKREKNSVFCRQGDILMLMDGSRSGITFRANVDGIVGSTLSVIRVHESLTNVVYEYLRAMKEEVIFNNTGSAIPHANKDYINRMLLGIPKDDAIIKRFNLFYDDIYTQVECLQTSVANLNKTKNLLLPRLISGKLSVENLDIQFPPSMQETR